MARTIPVHAENQWFQLAQTLKTNRQKRSHERLFLVEGVRSINQLRSNASWGVEALLYAAGRRLSGWARDVLAGIDTETHLELAPRLMDKLSDRDEGSEIIALVKMPRTGIADIPLVPGARLVLLDRPGNPGNLGSIIRSCDAFGVTGIVLTGHGVDPYDPLVVRAAAGAFFTQRIARCDGTPALDAWISQAEAGVPGLRVIGTSAKADGPLTELDLGGPLLLCFGNETMGLSQWLKNRCHALAGIPMQGVASSLNLACAVTAVLFEADRQGRARKGS